MDGLSYFALGVLFFVVLVLAYGMIAIHDIPYLIAKARNHPHQDAIHAGGWVSLFTLHAIWPFLWLWAYSYHPVHGYAGKPREDAGKDTLDQPATPPSTAALEKRIAVLEAELERSKAQKSGKSE
ncbi:MAG TPA: DUF3302 domain-containing protein [Chthoniobacterales bacterium]|nr:DUF3302 domain-containing protein [Chthoniobacterales bacterium]